MNIRGLIEKYNKLEENILFMILLISGILSIIVTSIINNFLNKEGLIFLFLQILSPFLTFGFIFILGIYIFAKIRNKFNNKIIEYVGNGFYKINDNYYSIIWEIKKEIKTNDIVELNKTIDINEIYYLISSKKTIEITKEQYNELSKVSSLKNKPILMLSEEEYNNFVYLGKFISFEIV